jgi:hypothetical protein
MDTSNLDDKKNEYFNLMRDQILAQKRMMAYGGMNFMGGMGAPMGGYGGMGGIGGMSGMGGMSSMGDISGYGGMGGIGAISGTGAPPGGFMASMVAPSTRWTERVLPHRPLVTSFNFCGMTVHLPVSTLFRLCSTGKFLLYISKFSMRQQI